ncbi:MAG TPA: hypothetical protein VLZ89_07125 [Anaerolineales bacterium]|nr:hypothetical protein [Anaerolineales bacterium]
MDEEKHFYQKPWFKSLVGGILLLGIYGYEYIYEGGLVNLPGIVFDLVLLFFLFQLTVAFYAQFVLPIHKRVDRRQVISRLWLHAMGGHGPAIFVKNGRLVESKGEYKKRGPGVLWLDSASAVVTRTDTAFKNFWGPGVHFTSAGEKIASVISLHMQSHRIGPEKDDDPFKPAKDYASEEEHKKVHDRQVAVRAITRDGIEVVPNITVTFKIDAAPSRGKEKGSRFGFDQDALERAVHAEGISAGSGTEQARPVAWNQLPALIAADLWREYLGKFTLNELFCAGLKPPPEVPQPEAPAPPPYSAMRPIPIRVGFFSRLLRRFNNSFEIRLKELIPADEIPESEPAERPENRRGISEPRSQTALQLINQMIRARMTQAAVPVLDESGQPLEGFLLSQEFKTLSERGIRVYSVSVNNLRFNEDVENQLIKQWNTNWLENARADHTRVERLKLVNSEGGYQRARQEHASALSRAISNPPNAASALKALLQQIQAEIRQDDRLLGRIKTELQDIDEITKWLESKEL